MADCMTFPQIWEQFLHDYEFEDSRRIYTNGARLIPSFRVKQMMEHYLLEAKSEAIKEFAEKLTNRICENVNRSLDNPDGNNYFITDVYEDIDNLVKEMTEGKENA